MTTTQIMQAIADVSEKVNQLNARLDDALQIKTGENKQGVADAQNATIELGVEIDSRISDLENALCELSEE